MATPGYMGELQPTSQPQGGGVSMVPGQSSTTPPAPAQFLAELQTATAQPSATPPTPAAPPPAQNTAPDPPRRSPSLPRHSTLLRRSRAPPPSPVQQQLQQVPVQHVYTSQVQYVEGGEASYTTSTM
ncbi:hypothetical protein SKAU_G00300350 [Synaphobranchus kaupii]|uniref:RFX1 transcription activation region domain-containing protein n=1 Tax=Synaphobranchus kaupii TaxID=118154 RepID=A0A9Q1EVQ1_SYNKA|nr:hypothetical protein SKAU_G00300350 [Synaphobranchus kaupii]